MIVPVFTEEIVITPEHLDEMRHVNNTCYIHWMQEVAIRHSEVNGWNTQRYIESGAAWFVRQHTINYLQQVHLGDAILAETWISEMKHVSCLRQYRFRRKSDGTVVAAAQTRWGMVDLKTGRPHRVPEEMLESFIEVPEEPEI